MLNANYQIYLYNRTMFKKGELVPGVRAISELFHTVMADLREISIECIQSEEIAQAVKSADVTIVNFMGSESGIYLTWKYNVTLAYLVGQQVVLLAQTVHKRDCNCMFKIFCYRSETHWSTKHWARHPIL